MCWGKLAVNQMSGETVLNKLLYFIDFDYYEKFEENLMEQPISRTIGPTPVGLKRYR